MLKSEQVAAIESHLRRIERRQRRVEFVVLLVLVTAVVGMLFDGDRAAFSTVVVIAALLGFAGTVRSVVAAGSTAGDASIRD